MPAPTGHTGNIPMLIDYLLIRALTGAANTTVDRAPAVDISWSRVQQYSGNDNSYTINGLSFDWGLSHQNC